MAANFYSPLRYPGGKTCIYKFVTSFLDENELNNCVYAEPYAGGAGLALKLLFKGNVEEIVINDLDRRIAAFWKTILAYPDDFCEWIENVDVSISQWRAHKKVLLENSATEEEVAKAVFFLNRTNVSGVIKGGPIGGFEQKGKYTLDARFKKEVLIGRIQEIARFRDRITFCSEDGCDFVRRINKTRKKAFVYLDPPYVQKANGLYMNFYSEADHRRLSDVVKSIKKSWLVSYDHHAFVHELYQTHKRVLYRLSQNASNRIGDEVLICPERLSFTASLRFLRSPIVL